MKRINKIMANITFATHNSSFSKEEIRELGKEYPYSKFQLSCVAVIGNLMKRLAKSKKQKFLPSRKYIAPKGKGAHPCYAILAYHINGLIDQGKHKEISINEIRKFIENGNIVDYLEKKFQEDVDFSIINKKNRKEINNNLNACLNGYYGQEKKKFLVGNYGLNLILAYLINIMQEKISEYIHPKLRSPMKYPEIDR